MPNVAMWGKALTVMPRITKQDWDELDILSRWLIATRSAVIVMTLTSAAFAGILALKAGGFATDDVDATLAMIRNNWQSGKD